MQTLDNTNPVTIPATAIADTAKPVSKPAAKSSGKAKPAAKPETTTPATPIRDIAAERLTAKQLHAAFEAQRLSVPVKTTAVFKPVAVTAHPIARKPSMRQAAAIAVAFAASKAKLADNGTASRVFKFDAAELCIENGALRDAISSGLITASGQAGNETIKLSKNAAKTILGLIGEKLARKAGLL